MAMLHFGGAMCNAVARFAPRTIWRLNTQQLLAVSSSAAASPDVAPVPDKSEDVPQQVTTPIKKAKKVPPKSSLVQAAFASILNDNKTAKAKAAKSSLASEIFAATTVERLLTIASSHDLSRREALHIMSILSEWMNEKKVSLADFDKDPRFLKLSAHVVDRQQAMDVHKNHSYGDLGTILRVTGDDEAAKLITTFSLDQMIKVITTLAHKRRRSTPILRSLSFNIARNTEKMNVKRAADLLYAMAVLNFPDEVLLERASADLIRCIPQNKGNAVVGSILASIGFLRYKNEELLDCLCEWIIAEPRNLRPACLASLVLTLATVAHTPFNMPTLYKTLIEPLRESDLPASEMWLDVVWANVVMGMADPAHVASCLDSVFTQKLSDMQLLTTPRKAKLLNINAAAKLIIPNYKGPFLDADLELGTTTMERSKDKQEFTSSVLDTLSNLFSTSARLKSNINTGMGFILDAECYVDDKCNPLPIDQVADKGKNATRIGVIVLHYSDFCRGKDEPLGIYSFMVKLLEAKGYRIVLVPYSEYSPKDKLITRVKYIEQKIKSTVNSQSRT